MKRWPSTLTDEWRDELDEFHREWIVLLSLGLARQGMPKTEAEAEAFCRVNRLRASLYDFLPPLEWPPL